MKPSPLKYFSFSDKALPPPIVALSCETLYKRWSSLCAVINTFA